MSQEEVNDYSAIEGFNVASDKPKRMYFKVFDDSICLKSSTEIEGWDGPIETTNPKTKQPVNTWVKRFDPLICRIIDCNRFQRKFDDGSKISGFEFLLQAGNMQAVLTLTWCEPVLKRLLKVARNIDWTKPVRMSVFLGTKQSGAKGTAVSIKQGAGVDHENWPKVEEFWNREKADAGHMPQPVHNEFDDKWNYDNQNAFLGKDFMENVYPRIKEIAASLGIQQPSEQTQFTQAPAPQVPAFTGSDQFSGQPQQPAPVAPQANNLAATVMGQPESNLYAQPQPQAPAPQVTYGSPPSDDFGDDETAPIAPTPAPKSNDDIPWD